MTDVPVPTNVPPQEAEYHCHTPPEPNIPPTTERVVLLPLQIGFDVAEILVAAVEFVFTVTVTLTQVVVLQVPSARTK